MTDWQTAGRRNGCYGCVTNERCLVEKLSEKGKPFDVLRTSYYSCFLLFNEERLLEVLRT
jgi:hypothetical protein